MTTPIEGDLTWHVTKCGVNPRIASLLAKGLDIEGFEAVKAVRGWAPTDALFLLLSGGAGTGKSTAAADALKLACKPVYYYEGEGIVQRFTYSPSRGMFSPAVQLASEPPWTDTGRELWNKAYKCQILVIDDLGIENLNPKMSWLGDFQDLIDHRYGSGTDTRHGPRLRTVLTTNLSNTEFKSRYGARVADRIRECGIIANLGGESKRQRWEAK